MKTSLCKAKGRRLQQYIVKEILEIIPELTDNDVKSTPMGCNGTDVILSEKALKLFPFSIEAKNQERINIWSCIEQTFKNVVDKTIGVLIFSKNHKGKFACIKLSDFLNLYKELYINKKEIEKLKEELKQYEDLKKIKLLLEKNS